MDSQTRLERRSTFDKHPDSYERARPAYPVELVEDLGKLAEISPTSRILELGCGPGTLTRSLAEFGAEIVAIELGAQMAEAARRNLRQYSRVTVVTSSFEEWSIPPRSFDLVVAAGSYHWLDPEIRVARILHALRPGGRVAIVNKNRLSSGNAELEHDFQSCYLRWDPKAKPDFRSPEEAGIRIEVDDIKASPDFVGHQAHRYMVSYTYTTAAYRDLLNTYSDFLTLSPTAREGLVNCLCTVIDSKHHGVVTMRVLGTLYLAQKHLES